MAQQQPPPSERTGRAGAGQAVTSTTPAKPGGAHRADQPQPHVHPLDGSQYHTVVEEQIYAEQWHTEKKPPEDPDASKK